MDNRDEIRDFLRSRRSKITPEQAGLPAYGGNRRVPGLRREFDEAERAHLFHLVQAANTTTRAPRRPGTKQRIRPSVRRILDAMTTAPAYVRNERLDILASNRLAEALFAPLFDAPGRPANAARFLFLDSRAQQFYDDWERVANDTVAVLRAEAGRYPYDRRLSDLIGELSTRSETFRHLWAAHDVRLHRTGVKRLHHPAVGDLSLTYEAMELTADAGLILITYTTEPGSPSEDALKLLASWAATVERPETVHGADQP